MRADKRLVFILNFISICTLILGIIGLIYLPYFDSSTIIEEHAFSEGNSNSLFPDKWLLEAKKATHNLLIAQSNIKNSSNKMSEILVEVLRREIPHSFSDIADLKVTKRQFSVNSLFDEESTVNRFSEYVSAFVPARRGDSFESILFVVNFPWSIENNFGVADAAGIAIALAKYMITVEWLSKNIHFLFTDSRLSYSAGIRAFLKDYSSELPNLIYTGIIRTALVLQILNSTPSRILIDIESQDGMIPNQDLVNAVIKEFQSKLPRPLASIDPRIIWNSIIRQATNGGSEKAHTPLLQYSIPAYTIILTDDETLKEYELKSTDKPISFGILEDSEDPSTNFITSPIIQLSDLVKALEGIIRIQSNLHEELHHSFNFYLFTSYISHISSGVYIYPIIFLCTSVVFQIISLLQRSSSPLYFLISLGCLGYFILTMFPIYWLINNALKLTLLHKLFDLLYNSKF
ncbi:uncharacterized protein CMU_001180 [Cryptosporidium muris RN66]|uniref:Uncharacterized protein n=1 Tax=Cryptosporidium muris (strain RN66) TaxID=441375 RepID=B6AGA6_CRYMR|nr:uncharacterized protein CMU_001180 [Cryptosporidium muris RN66]EEA07247.1 hypothetical protein, conserved [Cryptosporidium muris RN66]|eukprot:XP_002141596.1 hypothetical protein [Cryptosporidium muris RN66]